MTSVTDTRPGRLGVLGGTFDPPHIGHLVAALSVREQLGLDQVLLVPAGDPWQKRGSRQITPADLRLAMVEAAVADVPGVGVSDLEVRRAGASYTIDTVDALRAGSEGVEVVVAVGRDAFAGLATWHRHRELVGRCTFAVVDREGADAPVAPDGTRVEHVSMPRLDVSSTDLRARVAAGRSIAVLVPPAVAEIVARSGLYRDAAP